jgi:hypothetical protein
MKGRDTQFEEIEAAIVDELVRSGVMAGERVDLRWEAERRDHDELMEESDNRATAVPEFLKSADPVHDSMPVHLEPSIARPTLDWSELLPRGISGTLFYAGGLALPLMSLVVMMLDYLKLGVWNTLSISSVFGILARTDWIGFDMAANLVLTSWIGFPSIALGLIVLWLPRVTRLVHLPVRIA